MVDVAEQVRPSWMSAKVRAERNAAKGGYGVFATEPIAAGEIVILWGGSIYTGAEFEALPEELRIHSLQVEEDLFLVPPDVGPSDMVNHACDPTVGMSGQVGLIAMRPIRPGEEITFDYAMTDSSPYDEFECACGSPLCRGRITGDDWRLPALQQRYAGYFSPYLQRRIAKTRRNGH